ncbi:hypothetical protein MKW98_013314 [Papaver atlanticum]|uniref:Uncharacterized protein n=1 Tax=Papaver atlanticum TaxID=357466 RepID=A0AAD4XLG1_9MAGN|nr:hypothetical protein MKW98_013314 [Papaver atlanticum]
MLSIICLGSDAVCLFVSLVIELNDWYIENDKKNLYLIEIPNLILAEKKKIKEEMVEETAENTFGFELDAFDYRHGAALNVYECHRTISFPVLSLSQKGKESDYYEEHSFGTQIEDCKSFTCILGMFRLTLKNNIKNCTEITTAA